MNIALPLFFIIAKKNFKKTAGCIALKKSNLKKLIRIIGRKTKVIIN